MSSALPHGRSGTEPVDTTPRDAEVPPMLKRLARTCYRRRWRVLAAWVVFLVAVSVSSSAAGGVFRNEFSLSGSESKQAQDLLEERGFDARAGFSGQIVFTSDRGVNDPTVRQAMEELFARVERTVPRTQVVSPYDARRCAPGLRERSDRLRRGQLRRPSRQGVPGRGRQGQSRSEGREGLRPAHRARRATLR